MNVYFIGIGGIGISALAKYFLAKGNEVSGSDLVSSDITKSLQKMGAKIFIGEQKGKNIPKNTDLILITPAIKKNNSEFKEAKKRKIKIQTWEEALGELTKTHFAICVSGTHGKSTTTSMIGTLLWKAKLDPTVIVGTKLKEFGNSNCRVGKSKYVVIEADEYESSFLNYWPKIIVLTNLEYEHPDYFKNFRHYLDIFKKYLLKLETTSGIVVANKDDKNVVNLIKNFYIKKVYYSLSQKEAKEIKKIIKIPGEHNISNALATLTVARILKIPDKITFDAISRYKGAWRRFETYNIKTSGKNITLVSDYGHHPTQVRTTLEAAKEKYPKKKIWMVYQPHQYLRTYLLFKDYVKAFDDADEIILPEIYAVAGREKKNILEKFSSKNLAKALEKRFQKIGKKSKVHFLKSFTEIVGFIKPLFKNGDVIVLMGAGDIYKIISDF